jgi:hypothetical protein
MHNRSPAHVRLACDELRKREVTRPMTVGAVADCMVFGNRGYALYPGKVRSGKEWVTFQTEHEGDILCIQSEYDDAKGAADAVLADPIAKQLLAGCTFQLVAQWERDGVGCAAGIHGERGGFDAIRPKGDGADRGYVVDMKVTSSTEPDELQRHAWRMHWPAQGAWYVDGARAMGLDVVDFYLLAVESAPPHCVTVLRLTEQGFDAGALEIGRRQCAVWLEKHRACEAADAWPGYTQTIRDLEVEEWRGESG